MNSTFIAEDDSDQRRNTKHDQTGAGGHEAEHAGAPAGIQARADQIRPGNAHDAIPDSRDPVADQEGHQNRPRSTLAEQHDQPCKDQDDEAHRDIRSGEPPFLARGADDVAGDEQLGQCPADVEQAAGQADQNFRVGQVAYEVRNHGGRADDAHRHHEQDAISQEESEIAAVDSLAVSGR